MKALIIGDSFVEGVDAEDKKGWAQRFQEKHESHSISISGIGGDNIVKIMNRLSVFKEIYDLVILQVGVNDSRYRPSKNGYEIEENDFKKSLIAFIEYFRKINSNVKIYCLGLTGVNEKFTDPYKKDKHYLNKNIAIFNQFINQVCLKENVNYIELPNLLSSDNLLSDGIHPSTKGHIILFENIIKKIEV